MTDETTIRDHTTWRADDALCDLATAGDTSLHDFVGPAFGDTGPQILSTLPPDTGVDALEQKTYEGADWLRVYVPRIMQAGWVRADAVAPRAPTQPEE